MISYLFIVNYSICGGNCSYSDEFIVGFVIYLFFSIEMLQINAK